MATHATAVVSRPWDLIEAQGDGCTLGQEDDPSSA
jgi:hypothetical protein